MNKLDEMYAAKERHVKEIGELMASVLYVAGLFDGKEAGK